MGNDYVIYTDGALAQSTLSGGLAFLILNNNDKMVGASMKRIPNSTSPRMELLAAIYAVASFKNPSKFTLYSDSEYVVNGIEKKTKKKANRDYWFTLINLLAKHEYKFVWTKGHANNLHNNLCDTWAQQISKNY